MTVRSGEPVLVIIDMQNYFVRDVSAHIVPVIADLAARWRAAGNEVVFTRYVNHPGSPYERLLGWTECMAAPQIEIVDELRAHARQATAVIDKKGYNLFADAGGAALIAGRGWRDIYLCGIATENCVLATALGAFELNLTPWLIEDASASHRGPHAHDAGVFVAGSLIGKRQIISVADIPVLPGGRNA
ncbi:isochorismatase family cysteine hydrolase [Nonomuraea sp. NPDC050153]|uniref:isochorismatase family cysteine hydrolase n=1 Tax=Nonomuraea sp. NPDC050153 TaxID=3364359 RepID=UPI00379523AC